MINSSISAIAIPGYQITEVLHIGNKTAVYRGKQIKNQLPVVIKVLNTQNPILQDLVSLKNQFAIIQRLEHDQIIKSYGLETYINSYALILEDFQGITLTQYANSQPLSLQEFFPIAIAITEALDYLYQQKIIHKDIKPRNILINPETKQIKLIDFSISSLLPKETAEIKNPNVLEGTLAYMSPEQTGRMNRGIDYRTDFYSLGVTFYELLTGQLPFNSLNPLELIYFHLAQEASNPRNIHHQIPEVVADIILKLMAKTAEERYQTAKGIKHDLEICQQMLLNQGEISDFQIAQKDQSDRFLIPEKLYGRETEVRTLLNAFERVSKGSKELMLVAGFSGIGKTAVVNEVHKPIVRQKGYFISGKYDQFQRNIPFSAFVKAFRSLIKQLLTESTNQLQNWQTQILAALGEQAGVIIEIIPELEKIIGQQPQATELTGNAAQNRFNLLFTKFIQVLATKEHPLVIFLDDLQWSDPGSLQLIQLLMSETDVNHLLLICAYRDNEVTAGHPFKITLDNLHQSPSTINQINLQPLEQNHLVLLIADTLNCPESKALALTELIFQKTQGNPLFTNQILKSLHEDGLIIFNYDQNYWQCDLTRSKSLYLNENIVDFLKSQLQKLPDKTQNILKIAACIGNQFDLETLAVVAEQSLVETATDIWPALEEEIIIPQDEVYKLFTCDLSTDLSTSAAKLDHSESGQWTIQYKFLHDRLQQAAYSLIPESDKQATHLKIGQLILKNIDTESLEEKIFEIVNQINLGIDLIINQSEKYELAKLNLIAGKKAKLAIAYEAAVRYLTIGLDLLGKDSWQNQYDLTLNLYIEVAEAEYLSSDFAKSIELANLAIEQTKEILDQVKLYRTQIQAYIAQNLQEKALGIGVQVLRKLGVQLPRKASQLSIVVALLQTKSTLLNKQIEDLLSLPYITDPSKLAAIQILSILIPAAGQTSSLYFPLAIMAMVRLSVKYGNSSFAAFAYSLYGAVLCHKLADIANGYKFGKLGTKLLEKINDNSLKCKIHYVFNNMVEHYKKPIIEIIPRQEEIVQIGLEIGDIEFINYYCWSISSYWFFSGQNLESVKQRSYKYLKIVQNLKLVVGVINVNINIQTISNLQKSSPLQKYSLSENILVGEAFNETETLNELNKNNFCLAILNANKSLLNYLFGKYQESIKAAELTEEIHQNFPGFHIYPFSKFYHSLALLALCNNCSLSERNHYIKKVDINQKKMKKWADHSPCNYKHKYDLVAAEKARILGKNWQAVELYSQAIRGAKENGYLQEEAIGNELAAKFYLARGQEEIAQNYLINAYYCYHNWGAKAKVEDLENSYPHLLSSIINPQNYNSENNFYKTNKLISTLTADSTTTSLSVMFDIETFTKAALAISSEMQAGKLISTLMRVILENVGAEKANLILQGDGGLIVAAQCENYHKCELLSIPINKLENIPTSLINYVANTKEDLLINDATNESDFATDAYIIQHRPKSILCTPILNQGQLIGILYLENTLTVGAFTPERLKILKLLSSQAAISLENAQLYSSLEEKVTNRTKELNSKNLQLEQTLDELKRTQAQLIQTEKMSSLGQVVAGVAHEINNPINFIHGNIQPTKNYFNDLRNLLELYQQEYPHPSPAIEATVEEIDLEFITQDVEKILGSMKMGAKRIQNIVLGLRNFSRLDEAEMKPVDIHEGIENTLMLLQFQMKEKLGYVDNIVIKNYGQLPLVNCYPSQLNQVFFNILMNAIDALYKHQKNLSNQSNSNHYSTIVIGTELLNQDWVRIAIKDNGLGMTEEVKKHIFDPFFTTKDVGEGTGLSLSISYQIVVEKHHGKIECISQPGQGAEFLIDIPLK
ncbi:MAG TPA: AAA family ATPase [Nostocaceae cyanobacterium]|nr:AAA family ATPase [Nostocaceae cyanobacterium]